MEIEEKKKIACFPKIGDYTIPIDKFIEEVLDCKVVSCPPITKKTLEIGSRNSPDTVCTPFKVILGSFMESLGKGANVLVAPAIGCRLELYDEVFSLILRDLGYEFEMVNIFEFGVSIKTIYKRCKIFNKNLTLRKYAKALLRTGMIIAFMDKLGDKLRKNVAFEKNKGEFEKNYRMFLHAATNTKSVKMIASEYKKFSGIFEKIPTSKPADPIRIGLVGDLYSVLEESANAGIVSWLTERNVEVHRPLSASRIFTVGNIENVIKKNGKYLRNNIGGNATESSGTAHEMAANGIDGIIHVKAATCTPEINAMSVLTNISKDFSVPILYFTFDTETSDAGVHTRLEAFLDMIVLKKEKIAGEKSISGN